MKRASIFASAYNDKYRGFEKKKINLKSFQEKLVKIKRVTIFAPAYNDKRIKKREICDCDWL